MNAEGLDQWGLPVKRAPKKPMVPIEIVEEPLSLLEDFDLTLRFLSEVASTEKLVITQKESDELGSTLLNVTVNAGDLSPVAKAAFEISDKDPDISTEEAIEELLDLNGIEKSLEKEIWDEVRHQGFDGITIDMVSHPKTAADLQNAKFEFEIVLKYQRPSDVDLNGIIEKALRQKLRWFT